MSNNELAIPGAADDDNTIVEHYDRPLNRISEGIEVTLAKRIMHPRSNRIMCLAARTSLPFNDSEAVSVSDLALHLPDGTNVIMSLGLGNDIAGGVFPPVHRWSFDQSPYVREAAQDKPLPLIMMALTFLLALYSLSRVPLTTLLAVPRKSDVSVEAAAQMNVPHRAHKIAAPGKAPTAVVKKSTHAVKSAGSKSPVKGAKRLRHDEFLLPPPPVTYSLPLPVLPVEQKFSGANGFSPHGSDQPSRMVNPEPAMAPSSTRAASALDSGLLAKSKAVLNAPVDSPAPQLERLTIQNESNSLTAPVPGKI